MKIAFHLRGGQTVTVDCDEVKVRADQTTGDLTSYEINGIRSHKPIYLRVDDVSAVVREK
jgi:hypothetical protein